MKQVNIKIKGISELQQGRFHQIERGPKETHDDHEKRTWREKTHYTRDGRIFIPPMALKKALETAAKFLSIKIPGQGKATYTKHFVSGIMLTDKIMTNKTVEDMEPRWVLGNARGQRGAMGPRVLKCFPTFTDWKAEATVYILDDTITQEVFERVLREAGNFIGLGVFRPENGGYYGRFVVESIEWIELG